MRVLGNGRGVLRGMKNAAKAPMFNLTQRFKFPIKRAILRLNTGGGFYGTG